MVNLMFAYFLLRRRDGVDGLAIGLAFKLAMLISAWPFNFPVNYMANTGNGPVVGEEGDEIMRPRNVVLGGSK